MAEDVPRNAGSPTKQRDSAAALICAAHGFFCSSPSCLLQGWGNLATQRALVSQPSPSMQHTQQIQSSTALSLTRPFHCAVDITEKIRKSGDALERSLWPRRALKLNVHGLLHTHSFSFNTQPSTVVPLCLLHCAFGTMSLCRAHAEAWPISTTYDLGLEKQGITAQRSKWHVAVCFSGC